MNARTIALTLAALFVAGHLLFVFTGDACPIHGRPHGHDSCPGDVHDASICLCFSTLLFSPAAVDFSPAESVRPFVPDRPDGKTLPAATVDLEQPPRLLFA